MSYPLRGVPDDPPLPERCARLRETFPTARRMAARMGAVFVLDRAKLRSIGCEELWVHEQGIGE